mgnify:CR=1 FL=1
MSDDQQLLTQARTNMNKSIEAFNRDLGSIRTGRANTQLIDNLRIDYYGSMLPINQMASVSVSDSQTIIIEPWDKQVIADLEKEILKSDLGLSPQNDGSLIRLIIPPLTEERRKDLVKVLSKRAEEANVSIRNTRRSIVNEFRALEKSKEMSQDEVKRASKDLQDITDGFVEKISELSKFKEKDIMTS